MSATSSTILIVEDSPDDFYATQRGLRQTGLTNPIVHCESGEEALDYLHRRGRYADDVNVCRPSIILLDLNLPGIDGVEVLRRIKSDAGLKRIPVIVLTTSDDPRDVADAYDNCAASYICKPVDFDGFLKAIQRLKQYWFEVVVIPRE